MNVRTRWLVAVGVVVLLTAPVMVSSQVAAQTSTGSGSPVNGCGNPILDTATTGWGVLGSGTTGGRVQLTDHVVANWAFTQTNGPTGPSTVGMYLPQRLVKPAQMWDFGADLRSSEPVEAQVQVDWYSPTSGYLGQQTAPSWTALDGSMAWEKVAARFTAPANAARANVLVRTRGLANSSSVSATMCTYTPATEPQTPPTTAPSTSVPPTSGPPSTTVPPTTTVPPSPDTTISAVPTSGQVLVKWTTTRTDITGWRVGRDKQDSWGTGPWSVEKVASAREHKFTSLVNGTEYTFTLVPHTSTGDLPPLTVKATPVGVVTTTVPVTSSPPTSTTAPTTAPTTSPTPPTSTPPGDDTEAAVVNGWGAPAWGYEFNVDGNFTGWGRYNDATNQHGNRQPGQCVIAGGNLELRSLPDRRTCGVAELNHQGIQYGRIETRVRSVGSVWKSLHIVWPDTGVWPQNGERDWREHTAGANCYTGFIHYPGHTPQVQQPLPANSVSCVNTAVFHNVAVEFTATHIRGWVDGVLWYDITCDADLCQMPGGGHLTIQNDDQGGASGNSATTYVDWIRFYPL